jgi:HPt (histidine-containing phosphotransfer) domain-containing protein
MSSRDRDEPVAQLPPELLPAYDPDEALRRCYDNPELVQEMARSLFDEADQLLEELRRGARDRDAIALERVAHRLRGTTVYLGAKPAAGASLRVEQIGASGDLATASDAIDALERELVRLKAALLDSRRRHA